MAPSTQGLKEGNGELCTPRHIITTVATAAAAATAAISGPSHHWITSYC